MAQSTVGIKNIYILICKNLIFRSLPFLLAMTCSGLRWQQGVKESERGDERESVVEQFASDLWRW